MVGEWSWYVDVSYAEHFLQLESIWVVEPTRPERDVQVCWHR